MQVSKTGDRFESYGIVEGWLIDEKTGLFIPGSYARNRNNIMNTTLELWNKRLWGISSTALDVDTIAVGGFTGATATMAAITNTDTALENELESDLITSVDDTGLVDPDYERIAIRQWQSNEANGTTYELGLKWSDGSLALRGFWGRGAITDATQANPVVITSVGHGLSTSHQVHIKNVGGMTEINDTTFTITVLTADTFELDGEDGSAHTAYTSGGTWNRVIPKASGQILETRYTVGLGRA